MIDLPKLPNVGPDDRFLLDTMTANAVNRYCIAVTIQLLEDPYKAVPEFLHLHDRYGDTHPEFVVDMSLAVAGRLTKHIVTRAEQADVAQLMGKLAYWIDGTKAVLSQSG
ncbi:hypothetical protein [Microbacterium sp. 22296]|uniref:hypothetical protein n=1 Tax=Microbacterium sp. 22296 TaxID=3453903 RepID=UPI003F82F0F7